MSPERWRRVEEIYHAVLSRPPERRPDALGAECGGDDELRREVESLLAARDGAGDFLESDGLCRQIAELASEARTSLTGSRLGNYIIEAAIGAGSMGEVYRARDTRLDRDVALKVLPDHLTHEPSRVARFQREAKATSALNHPNIVIIHEIGQEDGRWFIAAELIEGMTIRERISSGRLSVEEVRTIGEQCTIALAAAHRAGVIHRDIKPENIMIRADGVVKVVDFGLALVAEERPGWAIEATQTGSIMGTPRYMSPEQARGQKLDAQSDIFSLGAVLFEMTCGAPAFPGSGAPEVFAALLTSEPDFEQAGPLGAILAKALHKTVAERYQSMEEFGAALRTFDATTPAMRAKGSQTRRRQIGKAAAAIVVALGVGVTASNWMSRTTVRQEAIQVAPLATFAGAKGYPALSPDGTRVAFSWLAPGSKTAHIYVKPVGEADPVQLTSGIDDDVGPVWSPDGRQIAFGREVQGDSFYVPEDVYIIPSGGGAERKVGVTWKGVSWSPDGKWLALTRPASEASSGGIYLLSLEDGQQRNVTVAQQDGYAVFSPDGRWLAFRRLFSSRASQMFVVRTEGGPVKQLTSDPLQPIRSATWTPDSREIIFASLRSGLDGSLWRVAISGGAPRPISGTLRDASDPNLSKGGKLAYREEWMDSNLYMLTASHSGAGAPGNFGEPVPTAESSREDHSPDFSRDGERIAFVSERSGNLEIWAARRDGSRAYPVTTMRAQNTGTPRWSPDGKRIAFDSWASGASAIYVVDAGGGAPRAVTTGSLASWMPSWSPDGQWIYCSRGRSDPTELWKIPSGGGDAVQITHSGGLESHASPDGSLVYYAKASAHGRSIWSVPAAGGTEKPVAELARFDGIGRCWGVTKDGIFFVSYEDAPQQTVRFLNFQNRQVTTLFKLEKQMRWGVGALAISWDGRYAVAAQLDHEVNNLMMIENFR